jgi:hypothetical protein
MYDHQGLKKEMNVQKTVLRRVQKRETTMLSKGRRAENKAARQKRRAQVHESDDGGSSRRYVMMMSDEIKSYQTLQGLGVKVCACFKQRQTIRSRYR